MKSLLPLLCLGLCSAMAATPPAPETVRTYRVRQNVTVSDIPEGARSVKCWIAIPDNERFQEVLDFAVIAAPGDWRVVREPDRGNRFLLVETANPAPGQLTTSVEFTLRRRSAHVQLDPAKVGPLTDTHRTLYAEELRHDAPHMTVTPRLARMANEACGDETNVALQARRLLNAVADYADHYSKDPSKPHCGIGDAEDCLANAGGCCTDLHSLFIALARSRGIPTRLQMGYRLREVNEGKEVDPGYRCWVEYFAPGYGWISADIVEADAGDLFGRTQWFTGLTERRLWLNEGREFALPGWNEANGRVNTVIIGYAEIDGVAARVLPDEATQKPAQLSRTVHYVELKAETDSATLALAR